MSDQKTTRVIGYFNPHDWPVYIEVSELGLRITLEPNVYIKDLQGNFYNDPIFEQYVSDKGLSRTTGHKDVPIRYAPRPVRSERPAHAVTQAATFVRDRQGTTLPVYNTPPTPPPEIPVNKNPVLGMSVETARRLGYVGRPRLVPEDYGLTDSSGAPITKNLPPIKFSVESPPRIQTAAPVAPVEPVEPANVQEDGATEQPEEFKAPAPVRLRAPAEPTRIAPAAPSAPIKPTVADDLLPAPEPVAEPLAIAGAAPLMPEPLLESSSAASVEQSDKKFVCAADGRAFRFRSELLRYVKAKYPNIVKDLMTPYPPDSQAE
jgi:hypothetical protein